MTAERASGTGFQRLGVDHIFQGGFVADDQVCALELHELFPLELREQAADRFSRGANDFGNFLMGKHQLHLQRIPIARRVGPSQQ